MLTDRYSEKLFDIIDQDITVQEMARKFENVHNKIKFKSFGKVKTNPGSNIFRKVKDQQGMNNDKEEADRRLLEQENKVNKEIEEIKKIKGGKMGRLWEIKKRVLGNKKSNMVPSAVINPKSGKLEVSSNKIKEVSLQYCIDTLSNNKPTEGFEEYFEEKKKKVRKILNMKEGSFCMDIGIFWKLIKQI